MFLLKAKANFYNRKVLTHPRMKSFVTDTGGNYCMKCKDEISTRLFQLFDMHIRHTQVMGKNASYHKITPDTK